MASRGQTTYGLDWRTVGFSSVRRSYDDLSLTLIMSAESDRRRTSRTSCSNTQPSDSNPVRSRLSRRRVRSFADCVTAVDMAVLQSSAPLDSLIGTTFFTCSCGISKRASVSYKASIFTLWYARCLRLPCAGGADRVPPRARGAAVDDIVGGICGEGGTSGPFDLNPGKSGAVR